MGRAWREEATKTVRPCVPASPEPVKPGPTTSGVLRLDSPVSTCGANGVSGIDEEELPVELHGYTGSSVRGRCGCSVYDYRAPEGIRWGSTAVPGPGGPRYRRRFPCPYGPFRTPGAVGGCLGPGDLVERELSLRRDPTRRATCRRRVGRTSEAWANGCHAQSCPKSRCHFSFSHSSDTLLQGYLW